MTRSMEAAHLFQGSHVLPGYIRRRSKAFSPDTGLHLRDRCLKVLLPNGQTLQLLCCQGSCVQLAECSFLLLLLSCLDLRLVRRGGRYCILRRVDC